MNSDLISYYKERAKEYENVHLKPERQNDLSEAVKVLQNIFKDKQVFEIACGTGYWTEKIAVTAKKIIATDINESVIEIAKSKNYLPAEVEFRIADIYNLETNFKHKSLFGGFIWSHIKLDQVESFIITVNNLVKKGGSIVFMDNNYVEGSSLPITEMDASGNTYQTRLLENGSRHKVLKNFPSENFLRQVLSGKAAEIKFINLQYYWILEYQNIR